MRKLLIVMVLMLVAGSVVAKEITPLKTDLTPPIISSSAQAACVAGNDNFDGILGYYGDWFYGNEAYAVPINAGESGCSCAEGVTVTTIHMLVALDEFANLDVAAAVLDAQTDGAGCLSPGVEIAVSAAYTFNAIPELGYYDIAIPITSPCATVGDAQFIALYFLNDNDGQFLGIPISDPPNACFGYNDYGAGYEDLVADYGFAGDILIWADMECCADPVSTESSTFGNVKSLFR